MQRLALQLLSHVLQHLAIPLSCNCLHLILQFALWQVMHHHACRPVECDSKQPLQFNPGFINSTIYADSIQTGWSWNAYQQTNKQLQVANAGVDGSSATCVEVKPQGGLSFVARNGSNAGYQPFIPANADSISFYVKQTSGNDIGGDATAPVPPNVSSRAARAPDSQHASASLCSLI